MCLNQNILVVLVEIVQEAEARVGVAVARHRLVLLIRQLIVRVHHHLIVLNSKTILNEVEKLKLIELKQ